MAGGDVGVGARPMGSGTPALREWDELDGGGWWCGDRGPTDGVRKSGTYRMGEGGVSMVDQKALGVNGKHLPRPAGNFGKPSSNIYIYIYY